jgi:hypothetical protein
MKKARYLFLLIAIATLSSCGLFRKDCHCPHFGKVQTKATTPAAHTV